LSGLLPTSSTPTATSRAGYAFTRGELLILWSSAGQQYYRDLIVVENDGTHWVVKVKINKETTLADVLGKREAAIRWAKPVTANESVAATWRSLLASESDVDVNGSWSALKKLGS
jgi:type III restriction enzyme